jgi:hypothetical protein
VRECDDNLGERLRTAERFCADIERQVAAGDRVLDRLVRIVSATRPETAVPTPAAPSVPAPAPFAAVPAPAPASTPDPRAMVAAAQALAQRTRSRMGGRAA